MGQKTHPIGFRLGINKPWLSTWFESGSFAEKLHEDMTLRRYINHRLANAGISRIEISRTAKKVTLTIHTSRPGIVIGRGGEEVERLRSEIRRLLGQEVQLNVSEVKRPELDARLVGDSIAQQLLKKISFRRAAKKSISQYFFTPMPPCANLMIPNLAKKFVGTCQCWEVMTRSSYRAR